MIKSFRHKGVCSFFETGSLAGIQASHAHRLARQLSRLNSAAAPNDMNLPGWRLHRLHGNQAGLFSVNVSANWRLTFEFYDGHAENVDYEDYH